MPSVKMAVGKNAVGQNCRRSKISSVKMAVGQSCVGQKTWNRLNTWCEVNMLPSNVKKCKTLTFTRSFHPIIAFYVLNGKILERVSSATDLEVILDSILSFREHIDSVVNNGSPMFGFIKRMSKEFRDPKIH
jgi:hypothetical protein